MIELTPTEVENCRQLKTYTESRLAEELFTTLNAESSEDMKEYMDNVRRMCVVACKYMSVIVDILKSSDITFRDKDKKEIAKDVAIDNMFEEAGPLSVYYQLKEAKDAGKVKNRDDEIKDIDKNCQSNIKDYQKKIGELTKLEREEYEIYNHNLKELRKGIEKKSSSQDLKKFNEKEPGKKEKEDFNKFLDVLKRYATLSPWNKSDIRALNQKYYFVKKATDLGILQQYQKIEWAMEEAERRKRLVPAKHLKKLKSSNVKELLELARSGKLNPADCSDIFRLFATVIEEIGGKVADDQWDQINNPEGSKITKEQIRTLTLFQKSYRGTSGLSMRKLFPDMPDKLAKQVDFIVPDKFSIDKEERASDAKWKQTLQCTKCGEKIEKTVSKPIIEKSVEETCPACTVKRPFNPLQPRPFFKGTDALRSRERDVWAAGFILDKNSVVRAIDRTFGLPEGADISGTTADSIFGMETIIGLGVDSFIETRRQPQQLAEKSYEAPAKVLAENAPLILLPLLTMPKLRHHTILECAMTLVLTGYIDSYRIGQYTSLWPKGSAKYSTLYKILEKWENAATNTHMIIDRAEDGFVERGWLFKNGKEKTGEDGFEFYDIAKVDYQRYVSIFMPLRELYKANQKISKKGLVELMETNRNELIDIEFNYLDTAAERIKANKGSDQKTYQEFTEQLYSYASRTNRHKRKRLADLAEKIYSE